jgi:hypothetical protein
MAITKKSRRMVVRSPENLEMKARALVESHEQFFGRARILEFEYHDDVLVVRGNLPTFYLKQILQSVLKDLDGVRWVDNQVTVDWNDGLIGPTRS